MTTNDYNLIPLRNSDVTPVIVAQSLAQEASRYKYMYVVAITEAGDPEVFATTDVGGLPLAALCMQELAMSYLRPKK